VGLDSTLKIEGRAKRILPELWTFVGRAREKRGENREKDIEKEEG
jgi:hypothetical protein